MNISDKKEKVIRSIKDLFEKYQDDVFPMEFPLQIRKLYSKPVPQHSSEY